MHCLIVRVLFLPSSRVPIARLGELGRPVILLKHLFVILIELLERTSVIGCLLLIGQNVGRIHDIDPSAVVDHLD